MKIVEITSLCIMYSQERSSCPLHGDRGFNCSRGEHVMRKNHLRTRLLAAAGSMLAAGAIAVSGIVAAAAAPHTAQARTSGIEHFQVMSTSETSNRTTVIAHGVFTAGGVDISTSNTTDTFKFPNGTIRVRHS